MPHLVVDQIAAWDRLSRWEVIEAFRRAAARSPRTDLDMLQAPAPYSLKAIQVV